MITWTRAITTGVEKIDKQHQMLFNKFNQLEAALESRSLREAGEILGFLQFYADMHFAEEEQEMEEKHCPVAAQNKHEHAYFRKEFGNLYEKWQNGDETIELFQTAYNKLETWLITHVMEIDSHLRFE